MIIFTDDPDCAELFLTGENISWDKGGTPDNPGISALAGKLFRKSTLYEATIESEKDWRFLLIAKSAPESQYDILIDLCRKNVPIPQGTVCLAGKGSKFHGFKGRSWDSPEGNIYLSAHFAPETRIENYGPGFMVLAAVSVIDAIDEISGLANRSGIKWVNDIFIDGAKVCGVLAHALAEGNIVTNAIIGIGLNVETTPSPRPTIFIRRAASLNDFAPDSNHYTQNQFFELLSKSIYKNYLILKNGNYQKLIDRYRQRSVIIGREVAIYEDLAGPEMRMIANGTVKKIGGNLELYLNGFKESFNRGRLALKKINMP